MVKNVFLAAFDVMGLFLVPIATDNYAVASVRPRVGTALSGVRLQDTDYKYATGPSRTFDCKPA